MRIASLSEALIRKYDVPVPRYTSYPTVPFWRTGDFDRCRWIQAVKQAYDESNDTKGISIYMHLPFCESLCTYCACNTRITRNHGVEETYKESILKEWNHYKQIFGGIPVIRELHLGGGTPTFFSPENLRKLLRPILNEAFVHPDHTFSFEGHPNNTTEEHLKELFELGFRRVSYGVQDLDARVQKAIHRIQPFKNIERVTSQSREIGYTSVSFDLIYGLPYQTIESVVTTMTGIISLQPDRIAFYSYAHVPWMRPGQRGYEDADLPGDVAKRSLYEAGKRLLSDAGYADIGMDHFALPDDALAKAQREGTLHRNFMGYTTTATDLLIGLGASAISDAGYAYAQNLKHVEAYAAQIENNELAVWKGHIQSPEDVLIKRCILDIACKGAVSGELLALVSDDDAFTRLKSMEGEGLIEHSPNGLVVTDAGRPFIRNICSVFDRNLRSLNAYSGNIFSKSI